MALRTSCAMENGTVAIAITGRPHVREHVWNWSLIWVLMACVSFWLAVISLVVLAV